MRRLRLARNYLLILFALVVMLNVYHTNLTDTLSKHDTMVSAAAIEAIPGSIRPYPLGFNYPNYRLLSSVKAVGGLISLATFTVLLLCLYREAAISDKEALSESK